MLLEGQYLESPTTLTDGELSAPLLDSLRRLVVTLAAGGEAGQVFAKSPLAPAEFLASAQLPAAGDWTAAPAFAILDGMKRVGFLVTYTGAAAAGQVKYRVRKGFSSTLANLGSEQVTTGDVTPGTAPVGSQQTYDAESIRPVTATTATAFAVDVDVEGGWTHVTLELAENGAPSTQGTAGITVAGSY
jgi:hypothetical protein